MIQKEARVAMRPVTRSQQHSYRGRPWPIRRGAFGRVEAPALYNIQGHIIPGFKTQFQEFLFLDILDAVAFKRWLRVMAPSITTAQDMRDFKPLAGNQASPLRRLGSTWISIAFSYQGLAQLTNDASQFKDEAFKAGMWARSELLGDPTNPKEEGHPSHWEVGGAHKQVDAVIVVARDDKNVLDATLGWIKTSLEGVAREVYRQLGNRLQKGTEHFGYLDGISQPGLRGLDEGKGRELVWPGEFVFGYRRQNPQGLLTPGEVANAGPAWGKDGSFLVFRRLKQNVPVFRQFLAEHSDGVDEEMLAAKLMGRWRSGAPLLRARRRDNRSLGADELKNNAFSFKAMDPNGEICPFASHIRKAYPRDDQAYRSDLVLDTETTQMHRLLRRGIPYGPPYDPRRLDSHTKERGLLFLAYQTSIVGQFEHVMTHWMNNPNFREPEAGLDPLVGRSSGRRRTFQLTVEVQGKATKRVLDLSNQPWVIPTGGEYFFAPSIQAIRETLSE